MLPAHSIIPSDHAADMGLNVIAEFTLGQPLLVARLLDAPSTSRGARCPLRIPPVDVNDRLLSCGNHLLAKLLTLCATSGLIAHVASLIASSIIGLFKDETDPIVFNNATQYI